MPMILNTKSNPASVNIANTLKRLGPDCELIDVDAPSVLEVPTDYETDCLIILSTHKSKDPKPMLTAHFPGNWGKAGMGGEDRKLNIASGWMLKRMIMELDQANKKFNLNWPLFIEADHHGPLARVPMVFVEIGSSEKEWIDERAGEVVANAVYNAVSSGSETRNRKLNTAFGIGGGHYAREFTKIILEHDDMAVGHICPKYAIDSLDGELFKQAIEKSVDPVDKVIMLKESSNAKQKEKVKKLSEEFGIAYEEI